MDKNDFLELEYAALREEIIATQRRNFQTIGVGAVGLPAINYLANVVELQGLQLVLPFVVAVVVFLYLADNLAVIRCGQYIREKIEPAVGEGVGWERWLERGRPSGTRTTEGYVTGAVCILFFMYSVGATWLATGYAFAKLPLWVAVVAQALYAIGGSVVGLHLIRRLVFVATSQVPDAEGDGLAPDGRSTEHANDEVIGRKRRRRRKRGA